MDAQVVGNAFVNQYFQILHQSPELVHRFYQERSKLSRPDANGDLVTVTTEEAINEKILEAVDYNEFNADIQTVDAQESYDGGVIVLVTGSITMKDFIKKGFIQSFFLAPQDKGFYVLNDIFRYADNDGNYHVADGTASDYIPSLNTEVEAQSQLSLEGKDDVEKVNKPPVKEEPPVIVDEVPAAEVIDELPKGSNVTAAPAPSPAKLVNGEPPKMSYATIVKFMSENPAPLSVPAPVPTKPTPKKHEKRSVKAQGPNTNGSNVFYNKNTQESEDGFSIYVKNLPLSATPAQLEMEFKKFGTIKPNGIQVRSHKMEGFCYGFVDFEVANAVQSAIKASPLMIDGRQVFVEEKRIPSARGNNRVRFGYGEGVRGRGPGGNSSGRGYGRGDQSNRGSYGSRNAGGQASAGPTGDHGNFTTPQASTIA